MRPTVTVVQNGRSGRVTYQEGLEAITGYFEFGGGDVVATVWMGSRDDWQARHAWAVERRLDILHLIASEVIRKYAPGCSAEIDETLGDIVFRGAA